MAKARKRKPVNQRRQVKASGDYPTPETESKLKRCSLEAMRSRGAIGMEEMRAADEIARVFHGVTAGLFARAQAIEPARGSGRGMPAALAEVYSERYKPWADWASEPSRRRIMAACMDVIIDGWTVGEVDADRRWRNGTASELLREGLTQYARMAGWLRRVASEYEDRERHEIVAAIARATAARRAASWIVPA